VSCRMFVVDVGAGWWWLLIVSPPRTCVDLVDRGGSRWWAVLHGGCSAPMVGSWMRRGGAAPPPLPLAHVDFSVAY
jgi:hypothetical protein